MTHWMILATPFTLLLLVLFLGNGCDWFGGAPFVAASQTYDQTVAGISGLVAYWALAETSGTTAADSVGKDANHPNGADPGTYTNLPAAVPYNAAQKSAAVSGQFTLGAQALTSNGGGPSVLFDGGFVEVPFDATLNPATFTVAIGVSPGWTSSPTQPAFRVVIESGDAGGFTDGFLLRSNTQDQWEAGVGNGTTGVFVTGSAVQLQQPPVVNLLIATYDGTNLTLYVDGTQFGPSPVSYTPSPNSDLRIGSGSAKKTGAPPPKALWPFQGRISSVALFNRALTNAELASLGSAFLSSP